MLKDIVKTSLLRYFSMFVSLCSMLLVAKVLGAELRGEISLYLSVSTLVATSLTFSCHNAMHKKQLNFNRLSVLLIIWVAILVLLVLSFFVYFSILEQESPVASEVLLFILVVTVISEWFVVQLFTYYDMVGKYNSSVFLGSIFQITVLVIASLFSELNLYVYFVAVISSRLILVIRFFTSINKKYLHSLGRVTQQGIVELLKSGSKLHIGTVGQAIISQADVIILGAYVSNLAGAGNYQISAQLVSMFYIFAQSACFVFLSHNANNASIESTWGQQKCFIAKVIPMSILACVLAYISAPVIPLILGDDFSDTTVIFRILLVGVPIIMLKYMLEAQLLTRGMHYHMSLFTLLVASANLILNFNLIPIYGPVGAAASSVISQSLFLLLILYCFRNFSRVSHSD